MDIKKVKPDEILSILDNLVAKIPDNIARIIRNIFIMIFVGILFYVVYNAAIYGWGLAKQEGHELARDTKSIFLEEIEREYNRKRKNVKMPSSSNLLDEDLYKVTKKYEPYGREIEPETIAPSDGSLLEGEKGIRSFKDKTPTSPLSELDSTTPTTEPSYQDRKEYDKPKRNYPLKDSFDSPTQKFSDPTSSFGKSEDDYYSSKSLEKNKKEESTLKVERPVSEDKKNRLQIPSKQNSSDKGKLLPIE